MLTYAVQLIQGIQYFTFALIFGGMLFLNRRNRSVVWLFANYVLGSFGLILSLDASHQPAWLSNVVGMEIPQIRYGLLHAALVAFVGRWYPTNWVAVVLALACLPFYALWSGTGFHDPAFATRNYGLLDLALGIQTALSAWLLSRSDERSTRLPRIAMGGFLALYSATELGRLAIGLTVHTMPPAIGSAIEAFGIAVYVVASSATPLGFVWLLNTRLMDDLKRQSILDPLTQLLNRRGLHQVSERELSRCGRSGQSLALAVADIDHFKRLNDTFGHTAGDLILRDIAGILQELVRRSDCVARIGGEEFVILFPESDPDHALKLVERLRETVEIRDFPIRDNTVRVTVSFGITTTRGRTDISLDKLVEEADASLYAAKQAGRNRTQLFVPPGLPAAAG